MSAQNNFILTPFFLDQSRSALQSAAQPDWTINEPSLPQTDTQARLSAIYEPLAQQVEQAVRQGERPVSIAGDCCAALGVVAGLQRAGVNFNLLWLDAHGDFNTWETTPSGFLGGMPLAMLVGRGELTLPRALGIHSLPEDCILLSDARDLDAAEKIALHHSQVQFISDLTALLQNERLNVPLYIHFDTDFVNPDDAPAQGYPAQGGPSANEVGDLFRALAQTKNIVAVSVCAWNPDLDRDGRTQAVSMNLLHVLVREDAK